MYKAHTTDASCTLTIQTRVRRRLNLWRGHRRCSQNVSSRVFQGYEMGWWWDILL